MGNIKSVFSIKDLERLSGVKAHNIRIWEKRYGILEPMRKESNIRYYDIENLQKILNVTLLHNYGYKISKIALLSNERIKELVTEIVSEKSAKDHALSAFKLAMMNFDQALFFSTYEKLLSESSFRRVFYDVFIPLIIEIGFLWQAKSISPAHEHFISNLIKQKILSNTEASQLKPLIDDDKVYVLYLPENEIHELGLMYINYEIINYGYKTIYLGDSIPLDALKDMKGHFSDIIYICYSTVEPIDINDYVTKVKDEILNEDSQLWLIGRQARNLEPNLISHNIRVFSSIESLVDEAIN